MKGAPRQAKGICNKITEGFFKTVLRLLVLFISPSYLIVARQHNFYQSWSYDCNVKYFQTAFYMILERHIMICSDLKSFIDGIPKMRQELKKTSACKLFQSIFLQYAIMDSKRQPHPRIQFFFSVSHLYSMMGKHSPNQRKRAVNLEPTFSITFNFCPYISKCDVCHKASIPQFTLTGTEKNAQAFFNLNALVYARSNINI